MLSRRAHVMAASVLAVLGDQLVASMAKDQETAEQVAASVDSLDPFGGPGRRNERFLRQPPTPRHKGRERCPEPVSEINVAQLPQS